MNRRKRTKPLPTRESRRKGARTADRGAAAETAEDDSPARYGAGVHRGDVADIRPVLRQGATAGNGRLQHRDARRGQGEPADYRRQAESLRAWGDGGASGEPQPCHRAVGRHVRPEIVGTEDGTAFDLANPGGKEEKAQPATPQTIQSSAAAYRDLNATLGNFYEQPKNDNAEMEELLERIASLESELESEKGKASAVDDQVALMEKSYELAAKYMGGQNGGQPRNRRQSLPPCRKGKKNTAMPIRQVDHQVVSSLAQPMSNAEFVAALSQERNRGFNTAVGTAEVSDRNTIPAVCMGRRA